MDKEELIEVVEYYIDEAKEGLPSDSEIRFIITPQHTAIIDGIGLRVDRYIIKEQKIGAELYAKLLAVAKANI